MFRCITRLFNNNTKRNDLIENRLQENSYTAFWPMPFFAVNLNTNNSNHELYNVIYLGQVQFFVVS